MVPARAPRRRLKRPQNSSIQDTQQKSFPLHIIFSLYGSKINTIQTLYHTPKQTLTIQNKP
ncbi:hypothetical protein Hanom_Chr02g00171281 [Helianthus anomalus]